MIIYSKTGTVVTTIDVDDNSYRVRTLMGDNHVVLYFSLPAYVNIPQGAYIEVNSTRYTLIRAEALKTVHTRQYDYTVQFEAKQTLLNIWMYQNPDDQRMNFPLTCDAAQHLQTLVRDLNTRTTKTVTLPGGTQSIDIGTDIEWYCDTASCITSEDKLITYDNVTCWDALKLIAGTFETEFEIYDTTVVVSGVTKQVTAIRLKSVEYHKTAPTPLSYGKGNGFRSGVSRNNSGDLPPIDILSVQGGSDNIDKSTYGHSTLQLPYDPTKTYNQRVIAYDGDTDTFYDPASGGTIPSTASRFMAISGTQIINLDRSPSPVLAEDTIDCTEIYPKRVGTVTAVTVSGSTYTITDSTIPSTLDYGDNLIAGETMTLIFQSGQLAGREFDVKYKHSARQFTLVPIEEDGVTMPSSTYPPAVNDTYAIFHCALPNSYICDFGDKTGAAWEMMKKAVKYMWEQQRDQYAFSGELDPIYVSDNWVTLRPKLVVGEYVSFTDAGYQTTAKKMRITTVKDYINNPYKMELTLDTAKPKPSKTRKRLDWVLGNTSLSDYYYNKSGRYTNRTKSGLETTIDDLEEETELVRSLMGGANTQFRFVSGFSSPTEVTDTIAYNQTTKALSVGASYIQTKPTTGLTVKAALAAPIYNVTAFAQTLSDTETAYYLYAKVMRTSAGTAESTNEFILSSTPIAMESLSTHYHMLAAYIGKERDGVRTVHKVYGYLTVKGAEIEVDKIETTSGDISIDLENDTLQLGGKLSYQGSALSMTDASLTTPTLTNPTLTNPTQTGGSMSNTTLTSPTISNPTITTPSITGGSLASPTISSPTITSPTISNGTITTPTLTKPTVTSQISKTRAMDSGGEIPSDELVVVNTAASSSTIALPRSPEAGATYKIISQSASETTIASANADILSGGQRVASVTLNPYCYAEAIYVRDLGWCVMKNE